MLHLAPGDTLTGPTTGNTMVYLPQIAHNTILNNTQMMEMTTVWTDLQTTTDQQYP